MGAWAYCPYCSGSLVEPSAREVVEGMQRCNHCGRGVHVKTTIDELIVDLAERLETAERKIETLERNS